MKKEVIYLSNIVKAFKVKKQSVTVLHGVDLTVDEGDFAIIFGPSGCGKSTLLHIILGLEPPTGGQSRLLSYNMYAYSEDERSEFRKNHIGMVYQQPNWIKSLSVIENVAFSLSLVGVPKQQALDKAFAVLKTVGMENWAQYKPTELSSGQQQKVALARALVSDPSVIIADEPTGNLDYQSGIELMELFRRLNEQGKTVIMVTHNMDNLDYAKTVVQMFNGRVIKIFDVTAGSVQKIKKALLDRIVLEPHHDITNNSVQEQKISAIHTPFLKRFSVSSFRQTFGVFKRNLFQIFRFLGLLFVYMGEKLTNRFFNFRIFPSRIRLFLAPRVSRLYEGAIDVLEVHGEKTISRVDLIDLSIKNMVSKGTRTVITVGGMMIGIATIVFLVSIGYGLEKLVISRVARLEEMKQIDATPAVASNIRLTDEALAKFKDIPEVSKILPLIGVVGTINYQNSSTDVAVYGVLSDYLLESAIKPAEGKIFESSTLTTMVTDTESSTQGKVAGASTTSDTTPEHGAEIGDATFTILPNEYVRVREGPSATDELLGYTRRVEGTSQATEYWGGSYISNDSTGKAGTDKNGKILGRWLKAKVLLWEETTGENGKKTYSEKLDSEGKQLSAEGYFAELNMSVSGSTYQLVDNGKDPRVLGESTTAEDVSDSAFIDIAELEDTATTSAQTESQKISLPDKDKREAVVNRALLKLLGIEGQAIGKTFSIAFTATGELVSDGAKIESVPVEYTIVGVTPDTKTPIVYVPITDVKQLGVSTYSQTKLVVENQDDLIKTRKQVELLGFKTASVVDTVSQIENLFATARFLLGVLGVVALSVAALGMLNTLTVSLLERTHEVGMMKAIGMKSVEVQDLYLTESMIMGVVGGIGGLFLGFFAGKAASIVLSAYAVSRGYGVLDIAFVPLSFVVLILVISVLVGLFTGIYPAKRATKISALDALRYE